VLIPMMMCDCNSCARTCEGRGAAESYQHNNLRYSRSNVINEGAISAELGTVLAALFVILFTALAGKED
jgi:hypothetical protein